MLRYPISLRCYSGYPWNGRWPRESECCFTTMCNEPFYVIPAGFRILKIVRFDPGSFQSFLEKNTSYLLWCILYNPLPERAFLAARPIPSGACLLGGTVTPFRSVPLWRHGDKTWRDLKESEIPRKLKRSRKIKETQRRIQKNPNKQETSEIVLMNTCQDFNESPKKIQR